MGNFNSKMMAMDYLCHSLMEDGDLDMNADDLQEFIAQIELVPTLLKDNLHHLAYIERYALNQPKSRDAKNFAHLFRFSPVPVRDGYCL